MGVVIFLIGTRSGFTTGAVSAVKPLHHTSSRIRHVFCYDSNIQVKVMTFRDNTRARTMTNSLSHLSRVLRVHFETAHRRLAQKQWINQITSHFSRGGNESAHGRRHLCEVTVTLAARYRRLAPAPDTAVFYSVQSLLLSFLSFNLFIVIMTN